MSVTRKLALVLVGIAAIPLFFLLIYIALVYGIPVRLPM